MSDCSFTRSLIVDLSLVFSIIFLNYFILFFFFWPQFFFFKCGGDIKTWLWIRVSLHAFFWRNISDAPLTQWINKTHTQIWERKKEKMIIFPWISDSAQQNCDPPPTSKSEQSFDSIQRWPRKIWIESDVTFSRCCVHICLHLFLCWMGKHWINLDYLAIERRDRRLWLLIWSLDMILNVT